MNTSGKYIRDLKLNEKKINIKQKERVWFTGNQKFLFKKRKDVMDEPNFKIV